MVYTGSNSVEVVETGTSMVYLQRYWEWMNADGYSHIYLDPMDQDGFDAASSFPSVKPNIDVFGPRMDVSPRRRRGWYEVRRWPPVLQGVGGGQQHYATGAALPQELFDDILKHCTNADCAYEQQDLAQLRLVCRRWAELFQDDLFHEMKLRCLPDIIGLLALLDGRIAFSRVPVRTVHLQLDLSTPAHLRRPWIDVFFRKVLPRLSNHRLRHGLIWEGVNLHVSGPLPVGRTLTSVYSTSPRRCLWHPLSIKNLFLLDLHVKKLDDLIRLLRELPTLERVEGNMITWRAAADSPRPFPRVASFVPCINRPTEIRYAFNGSDPHSLEVTGWLAIALTPARSRRLRQTDANTLFNIVSRAFVDGCYSVWSQIPGASLRWESVTYKNALCQSDIWITIVCDTETGSACAYLSVDLTSQGDGQICSVESINFDFSSDASGKGADAIPWAVIDNLAADLNIQSMSLRLKSSSDVLSFHMEHALPNMPRLNESGRIKFMDSDRRKVRVCEDGTVEVR